MHFGEFRERAARFHNACQASRISCRLLPCRAQGHEARANNLREGITRQIAGNLLKRNADPFDGDYRGARVEQDCMDIERLVGAQIPLSLRSCIRSCLHLIISHVAFVIPHDLDQ
jgi:hypothetical protein